MVNAPVAAAWSAWATSEGIQTFFAPEVIVEARPEGRFSVYFNPYAKEGMNARMKAFEDSQRGK